MNFIFQPGDDSVDGRLHESMSESEGLGDTLPTMVEDINRFSTISTSSNSSNGSKSYILLFILMCTLKFILFLVAVFEISIGHWPIILHFDQQISGFASHFDLELFQEGLTDRSKKAFLAFL